MSENIKITLIMFGSYINVTKMKAFDRKPNNITHS